MMSLHARTADPIPDDTGRVAHAAFPHGHRHLRLRDTLGTLYEDATFAPLFSARGRPAEAPWRLALVTALQFAENLTDRQAADAVRDRLSWKYLLGLELADTGFDFTILSDFRARLVEGDAAHLLLDALLDRCKDAGLLKARSRQRTDSTHVLTAVRTLSRLECVGETLRHALNTLAAVVPDWLRAQIGPDWYDRYGRRIEETRLPEAASKRDALAATIGADGLHLLRSVYAAPAPAWLREIPAVQIVRRVWIQYYHAPDVPDGVVRLRDPRDMPPGDRTIEFPYDPDARYHTKRTTTWTGYTVHLTETCDEDTPHLVTQVATVPATTNDVEVTATIQADLATRDLLPAEHLFDAGYVSAQHLVAGAARGIDLVGPAPPDTSWQASAGQGFAAANFVIDWERRSVTCPQGKQSRSWGEGTTEHGHPFHQVVFAKDDCAACPCRAHCTRSAVRPRQLALRPREEHAALQMARQRQTTGEFTERYKKRAGVEGTMSQGVQVCGLRRSRYRGLQRTHLQHLATGVAISLQRLDDWWTETPRAMTRPSRFADLAA